jgi:Recombinase
LKKLSACPGWLGLSADRTSFVFLPDRAEIVQKIFELSIGGVGSYSIANYLNQQNVPAFGPSPTWDHSTIDAMLRSRATIGEHQPKSYAGGSKKGIPIGSPIPNYYPAVVDEATFEAAQKARHQNLLSNRGRKGRHVTNLFSGVTSCEYCSSPVKFHSNGDAKSLMCSKVLSGSGCIRSAWSYRNFERSVLHFIAHPAIAETLSDPKREILATLVGHIRRLSGPNLYSERIEITSMLKTIVSDLKLACAGSEPTQTLPDALIRRDKPGRFFRLTLCEGPTYVGFPIEE